MLYLPGPLFIEIKCLQEVKLGFNILIEAQARRLIKKKIINPSKMLTSAKFIHYYGAN